MKKTICILIALLIAVSILPAMPTRADEQPVELINLRTLTSKTFQLSKPNQYHSDYYTFPIHYKYDPDDENEVWKDIDTTIIESPKQYWDWEVEKNNWHVYIKDDTTVRLEKDGNTIDFIYEGFAYYDKSTQEYEVLDQRNAVTPTVTGNSIYWEDIFYGCDLEYVITNGIFKENLYIKQTARDWCESNPPSSFGLSNQDSYLTGYIRCDWTNAYTPEDKDGNYLNFNDYESEGVPIFWRHPIKDKIVSALPVGYAIHEDVAPENWVKLHQRFYKHTNNYNYLLFGAKVTDLKQYPAGTINLDPTIDQDVDAGDRDAYERESTGAVDIGGAIVFCISNAAAASRYWGGWKFPGAAPSGTIDAANMTFYTYSAAYDDANGNLHFEKTASPADFTTTNYDITGRTRTTASTSWVQDGVGTGSELTTPDISTPLQELVNAETVTDLVVVFRPNQDSAKTLRILAFDTYPLLAVGIHIDYTVGGAVAPTVVTGNASSILCGSATGNGNITATGGANATVRGFQYGVGSFSDNVSESGDYGTGNFSLAISSLNVSTEYQYRAFATNSEGTGYGASVNFTTLASANPSVTTDNATNISDTSAQLNATISGLTCANASDIGFEWGIASGNYTDNWTDTGSWGNVSFNHTPTLSDNTTYYYRGFARISGGSWQYGGEISFTTDATPPTPASVVPTGMIPAIRTTTSYTVEDICILVFPTVLFLAIAAWKRHPALFMMCGAASIFSGLFWYNEYTTNAGLAAGLGFIVFGLTCWGYAFREMLFASRAEE